MIDALDPTPVFQPDFRLLHIMLATLPGETTVVLGSAALDISVHLSLSPLVGTVAGKPNMLAYTVVVISPAPLFIARLREVVDAAISFLAIEKELSSDIVLSMLAPQEHEGAFMHQGLMLLAASDMTLTQNLKITQLSIDAVFACNVHAAAGIH